MATLAKHPAFVLQLSQSQTPYQKQPSLRLKKTSFAITPLAFDLRAKKQSKAVQRIVCQSQTVQSDAKTEIAADPYAKLSNVCAVLGTQWGDEGKGKLVDILAQRYDVVARCQVGDGCQLAHETTEKIFIQSPSCRCCRCKAFRRQVLSRNARSSQGI